MNKQPDIEHRRFTRVPFAAKAMVRTREGQWECAIIDISLKGALLNRPAAWPVTTGHAVDLEVVISEDIRIRMQGNVAHLESDRVGVVCLHIDIESAAHLRRLVEFNLGDEARLHRELQALIETHH